MNRKAIFYMLGLVLLLEAALMAFPLFVALGYREFPTVYAFLKTIIFCGALGGLMAFFSKTSTKFFAKEGFVIVALCWIGISLIGAIPFVLTGAIPNYVDALFETVSGFTTTGSSILTDVEALSHGLLFWRSFTHWIGGMGVLVFMLAILPKNKAYNMHLMRAESPGPQVDKLVPRVRTTAEILYGIYLAMTILLICILIMLKMPVFDAFCISFGTAGTGGFGVLNTSVGSYTAVQQVVIGFFMAAFGVNFNLYYFMLIGQWKNALRSQELHLYVGIIAVSTALITINIRFMYPGWAGALKDAFVQVSSIITTTGFSSTYFDLWPTLSRTILVLLMFCGACASSTGGGLKVSRILIGVKMVHSEVRAFIHPKSVRAIRVDGKPVSPDVRRSTSIYFIVYMIIFVFSMLVVTLDDFGLVTSFTAVAAAFNNIGPGLGVCGPIGNFSSFSILSKLVLIFDMLAGRLEIFPMLVLFAPVTWKR